MYQYAKWLPTVILLFLVIIGLYTGAGLNIVPVLMIWFVVQSLAFLPTAAHYVGKWWGKRTSETAETGTAETYAAETNAAEPESQWWLAHLFVTIGLILSFIEILWFGFESDGMLAATFLLYGMILLFVIIGVIGYYYDAKALKAADAAWQPNPWIWIVGGFIFGHVLLMPFYLARRWWTVGLDWSKLPVIGHRVSG
jgi:uncharacterized membrane protein